MQVLRQLTLDHQFEVMIFVLILGLLIGLKLARLLRESKQRRSGRQERTKGLLAEKRAASLLKKRGFKLLTVNPKFINQLVINGQPYDFEVTPDLLVEKEGQTFVVEVKSGFGDISNAPVRRQVLEYLAASGFPCLVVLMPEGEIDVVELP